MASDRIRIEVGFDGGQIMSAQITPDAATKLDQHLIDGDDGAFPFDTDDGSYLLVLRRVVYVKRFARESRLGFGG